MANADLLLGREPIDTRVKRSRRSATVKAPRASETQVVNAIRNRLALYGIVCQVVDNEGRSARAGYATRKRGVISGWPDLIVCGPGGRVAFLEAKAPGARASSNPKHWARQQEVQDTLRRLGQTVAQVDSQDAAVAALRNAGWPL